MDDIFEKIHKYYITLSDNYMDNRIKIRIEMIVKYLHYAAHRKMFQLNTSNNYREYIKKITTITEEKLTCFEENPYKNTFEFENTPHKILMSIYDSVKVFFTNSTKRYHNDKIFIYFGDIKCIEFYVIYYNNNVIGHLDWLEKSTLFDMSGPQLLENLESLLKTVAKAIEVISFEDQSTITWKIKEEYIISLAYLHILCKGQSWYNSLGFFQTNYVKEKEEWNNLRLMSLRDCLDSINKEDYYGIGNNYHSCIRDADNIVFVDNTIHPKYYEIIASVFNLEKSVADVCTTIYAHIKNKLDIDEELSKIYILILRLCFSKIIYDDVLKKRINVS